MQLRLVATGLLLCAACSHAPPPSEAAKVERRDDWLFALRSDLERIASNDGFQGQVRVMHAGKPEIDLSYGDTACLPLGAGRRLLATVAVGLLVDEREARLGRPTRAAAADRRGHLLRRPHRRQSLDRLRGPRREHGRHARRPARRGGKDPAPGRTRNAGGPR